MRVLFALILGISAAFAVVPITWAQNWGTVTGSVSSTDDQGALSNASIVVAGTDFGTATESDGRFSLQLPTGAYTLVISSVGFESATRDVVVSAEGESMLTVSLQPALIEMEGITIEEPTMPTGPGVYELAPEDVRNIPSPFKGFQSLAVLPGVAANNEMSNQYSVRGGGFNENLVFINGFEVHMPFRPRQGEQEGLGLLNPELADRILLYTAGFPARYGGKLSSALETTYGRSFAETVGGSASLSLLDAGFTNRGAAIDGRFGWNIGVRKARARHFFSTQEVKGDYRPDYTDVQGLLAYQFAPGHEVEALGIYADHTFRLKPQSRKTYFGVVSSNPDVPSNLRSFWINYDGEEQDGYATRFGGVRTSNRISDAVRVEHDMAYFGTIEKERFDIRGSAVIYRVDPGSGNPDTGSGHFPTGGAAQSELADNRIDVATWTGRGRYLVRMPGHRIESGWFVRDLSFSDKIDERTALTGRDTEGQTVRIVVDSLRDAASLSARQAGGYVQDAFRAGAVFVTAGVRTDYFSFTDEWTVAPRLAAEFDATSRLSLSASWGFYYQTPTYRELRGTPAPGETIGRALNREIQSQRSIQYVLGGTYFMPSRRLHVRAEAYYKDLDRLISYDIQNVRVNYSGDNDSRGRAIGLDVRVHGELVPGLESWLNYGYLNAVETFIPTFTTSATAGTMPRPADQRHTVSLFVQDYIPNDPSWKVHLRALFGSGLPYTPPVPGQQVGTLVSQVPGDRNSARYTEYRRVDLGATKLIDFGGSVRIELTAELLNVFDMTNTVAYSWVPNGDGIWERIPTRLTPRTFNVRVRLEY